jgi:hypothetical protein
VFLHELKIRVVQLFENIPFDKKPNALQMAKDKYIKLQPGHAYLGRRPLELSNSSADNHSGLHVH